MAFDSSLWYTIVGPGSFSGGMLGFGVWLRALGFDPEAQVYFEGSGLRV